MEKNGFSATAKPESEVQYCRPIESAPIMNWIADANARCTHFKSVCLEFAAPLPQPELGRGWLEGIHPEDKKQCVETYITAFDDRKPFQMEYRWRRGDGEYRRIWNAGFPQWTADGEFFGYVGSCIDISDFNATPSKINSNKAEVTLPKNNFSEANKNSATLTGERPEENGLFSLSLDMLCLLSEDGYFQRLNPTWEKVLGYSREEMLSKPLVKFVHPEEFADTFDLMQQLGSNPSTISFENRFRCKDRSYKWLAWTAVFSVEDGAIYAIARDVTERKQIEEELRESEERLRATFDQAAVGITHIGLDCRFLKVNQKFCKILGYSEAELQEVRFQEITELDDLKIKMEYVRQLVAGEIQTFSLEGRYIHKNDSPVWVNIAMSLVRESSGEPKYLIGAIIDVSDRKKQEIILQQSEAQLREQATKLQSALHELQQTQAQLIQTEKMSSLGQLVAGVAHEINNPVSFIYGNVIYASEYVENLINLIGVYQEHYPNPAAAIAEMSEEIELDFLIQDLPKLISSMKMGAERIRDIVLSLRNFSRLDESEMKPVNIHDGIDSTLMILANRVKETAGHPGIQVIKNYGNLPEVECYAGQLNQVFMNVLVNAIDALEEYNKQRSPEEIKANPSTITICTSVGNGGNSIGQVESPLAPFSMPNSSVIIRISDNGSGMTEQVRQRLFDPFFTTKPVGKGTGLGLSISYQIVVEKHKGSLRCISAPGQGAEFIVEIPIRAALATN